MSRLKIKIRMMILYIVTAVMLVGGYPVATFADDGGTSTTTPVTTQVTTPKPPPTTYTYDSATGRWSTNVWHYDQASGQYVKVSTVSPVESSTPPPSATPSTSNPPNSSPTTASSSTPIVPVSTTTANNTTSNSIGNTTVVGTQSGDATVSKNGTAGNATSGNASASTTVVNAVNSSTAGSPVTFTSNINGDVTGDIELGPMIMNALSSATVNPASPSSDVTVNSGTTNQITNTITLNTATGQATVSGNTNAGNATSGTANSVVNVMNIVNSIIAANKSFIGTVNIYGNLNGDILIAPNFIAQLLASNASSGQTPGSLTVNSRDTQAIVNNVNLSAQSGVATVMGNTSAGSATSGPATTNVTILNLSGHQIVASNSLLVFVNVLGKWVGVIVDVPAGGTAAALGDGVSQNVGGNSTVNTQSDTTLTNNINVNSQSGSATVANNTNAGNATSGNATASANILNLAGSNLGLSGWFGVLFINVFGTWLGSFGVNTSSGDSQTTTTNFPPVFRFVPKASVLSFASPEQPTMALVSDATNPPTSTQVVTSDEANRPAVLGTTTSSPSDHTGGSVVGYNASLIAGVIGASLLVSFIVRRSWLMTRDGVSPFVS